MPSPAFAFAAPPWPEPWSSLPTWHRAAFCSFRWPRSSIIGGYWGGYPTNLIPFCAWLLSGYFANLPREPEECAMVDGASRIGAIWRITLPMSWPGIITAAIFSFTLSWNELLYSIVFVSGDQNKMLTNGVVGAFAGGDWFSWGPLMAAATLSSIPVAILYLFFTDRFVSGIAAGATKG